MQVDGYRDAQHKMAQFPMYHLVYFRQIEHSEQHWPGRAEPLRSDMLYRVDDEMPKYELVDFWAGSYLYYNKWRDTLALFATRHTCAELWELRTTDPSLARAPFMELLDFSDCEGVIGSVVAQKLADDFAWHALAAKEFSQDKQDSRSRAVFSNDAERESWWRLYQCWKTAFTYAADKGAVVLG